MLWLPERFAPAVISALLIWSSAGAADCRDAALLSNESCSRPNIVVIMADDWSWPHAGIWEDASVKTPVFDRVAREGILFENAFATASSSVSSRFAIATGQYHWRLGEAGRIGVHLAEEVSVYSDLLAESGYQIGSSGKGATSSRQSHGGSDPFGQLFVSFNEFLQHRDDQRPFCFWHGAGEQQRLDAGTGSRSVSVKSEKVQVPECLPNNETVRSDLRDYYQRIELLDRHAGKILELLEECGELEDTIFVMSGDNGMPFPRCKFKLYDLGVRVPLAIRWGERVKAGRTVEDFVTLADLAATFLEAANLAVPANMTGRSLMPQLVADESGVIDADRDHVLTGRERHLDVRPSRAIRTADYLYIRNFPPASWPAAGLAGSQRRSESDVDPRPTDARASSPAADSLPTKRWMLEHASLSPQLQLLSKLAFGRRPEEELYDLKNDPDQLSNVVDRDDYVVVRRQLSDRLTTGLRLSHDPRFVLPDHATFRLNGWTMHLSDRLWQNEPSDTKQMLGLLEEQLNRVVAAVPRKALTELRKVPIWINPKYDGVRPTAEYHPGADWLRDNGRDPSMAKAIEITTVSIFAFENRRMPYLMLHELAHAYHDRVLGFGQPAVLAAFNQARISGSYESVQRFTGNSMITDRAYAISNHKEYFAESTEAYFGKNDFFPFNRTELKSHDIQMHNLLREIWGDMQ